jgi:predicted DNA-binding transcriptional regulator YafY
MPKPMIRIHDTETGEIIDREMTADEISALEASAQALADLEAATAAKAAAKQAVLNKLGLTAEELAALL